MRALLKPEHLALLDQLVPGDDPLEVRKRLDSRFSGTLAREITEQISLRGRVTGKFVSPRGLLLTAKGLEQATSLAVAARRARRIIERVGTGVQILDATAGLGADSIALAAAGLAVVAAEADPRTASFLAQNLRACGHPARVVVARLQDQVLELPFLLVDPDRRNAEGQRLGHPELWSPPFAKITEAVRRTEGAVLKLAPGSDLGALGSKLGESRALIREWVAWNGEVKEAALWVGRLAQEGAEETAQGLRRAVSLTKQGEEEFTGSPVSGRDLPYLSPSQAQGIAWISEPASCVLAAGLVGAMAISSGTLPVGPQCAYLGSNERPRNPCLATYRVLDSAPADRRRLRSLLRAHDIGPITVKRRSHPLDAESLALRFRGPGKKHGLVMIGRLEKGYHAWIVERIDRNGLDSETRTGTTATDEAR